MTTLNIKGALKKRNELVKLGFTIVPSVMPKPFLNQLQIWSEDIFRRVTIDHKIRYQGSDIFVHTERQWGP